LNPNDDAHAKDEKIVTNKLFEAQKFELSIKFEGEGSQIIGKARLNSFNTSALIIDDHHVTRAWKK
jgi:hypothetical protein